MDFAHTYEHYVMGASRYHENAYLLVEVDTKTMTQRLLNADDRVVNPLQPTFYAEGLSQMAFGMYGANGFLQAVAPYHD